MYIRVLEEKSKGISLAELAAAKAYSIGRRGTLKDYVDIFFIIKEGHADLSAIIQLAERKYKDEFNSRLFLEQLIYFEDVEDEDIIFLKKAVSKDNLQKFFESKIRKMRF